MNRVFATIDHPLEHDVEVDVYVLDWDLDAPAADRTVQGLENSQ